MINESLAIDLLKLFLAQMETKEISILPDTYNIGFSTTTPSSDGSNFIESSIPDGYQRYLPCMGKTSKKTD